MALMGNFWPPLCLSQADRGREVGGGTGPYGPIFPPCLADQHRNGGKVWWQQALFWEGGECELFSHLHRIFSILQIKWGAVSPASLIWLKCRGREAWKQLQRWRRRWMCGAWWRCWEGKLQGKFLPMTVDNYWAAFPPNRWHSSFLEGHITLMILPMCQPHSSMYPHLSSCVCLLQTTHPALGTERKPCSSMANVEPTSQQLLGGSTLGSCLPAFPHPTTPPGLDQPFSSSGYVPYYRTEAELCVGPAVCDRFLTRTEVLENEEGRWVEEKNAWNFGASCLVSWEQSSKFVSKRQRLV